MLQSGESAPPFAPASFSIDIRVELPINTTNLTAQAVAASLRATVASATDDEVVVKVTQRWVLQAQLGTGAAVNH